MKKRKFKLNQQRGFSVVEVIAATVIFSTVIAGAGQFQSAMMQKTVRNNDKSFAGEKALQMYDEMRAFVQSNQESFLTSLDNYSDGNGYNWNLTTTSGSIDDPADPLSGNKRNNGKWAYIRQIQVDPVPNDDYARQVNVKVWKANPQNHTKPMGAPLAAISGVLKTNVDQYPPTQVYDVFMFASENSPAWWVEVAALRPTFERLLDDLEYRNPGLRYRRHYVSRLGFGRDPFYLPYMNSESNAASQDIPWTYFYPGKIQRTNSGLPVRESYVEAYTHGRRRNDDAQEFTHVNRALNGDNAEYRHYAMADQFNHIKRYPENSAMLRRLRSIDPDTEVDLVTYLEELNSQPDEYRNSLIINLHGELIPLPPIRNYSDAAKSPEDQPNLRVVTHPEQIRYDNNASAKLRVYAYQKVPYGQEKLAGDDLDMGSESQLNNAENQDFMLGEGQAADAISVFIPTDDRGRNPFDPVKNGFLDHPQANITEAVARKNIFPTKIIGNHRRPYVKKEYIGRADGLTGEYPNKTTLTTAEIRKYYRQTTETNTIGERHTIELARDPRLPSDVSFRRGGISNTVDLDDLTNGSQTTLSFDRDDFNAYLGTVSDTVLELSLNELVDQLVVLDPDIINPRDGSLVHQGLNLELRVQDFDFNSNTVRLNFYSDGASQAQWGSQISGYAPSVRLNYARNAAATPGGVPDVDDQLTEMITSWAAGPNNVHVFDGTNRVLNRGTRVVLKRDFEITTSPTVFGDTVPGIHIALFDTPTRHMQKEGYDTFPVWNENANGVERGRYSGLYHDRGNDNEDAHQQGDTRRLNREEYVPAPVNQEGTPNDWSDDFDRDLTSTDRYSAKNTARWILEVDLNELNNESSNAFSDEMLTVETRIGPQKSATDPNPLSGRSNASRDNKISALLAQGQSEDGDVYAPNTTASTNENRTVMRENIYNVSRTFVWTGSADADYNEALNQAEVPFVERRQYLGDPRYMPYADLKALNTYNRHFYRDRWNREGFAGLSENGMGGYDGYGLHRGPSWGGNNVAADLNWYFQLYTNGLMTSNSIYNSVTGYSNYYYSIGGEMGADSNSANFNMRRQPWSENDEGNGNASNTNQSWGNEIIGDLRIPMSTNNTTANGSGNSNSSDNRWYANPFLGELFPDEDYAFWRDNGNLPNRSYNSSHTFSGLTSETSTQGSESNRNHRFFRARYSENPINLSNRELRMQGTGAPSFMNGNNNPSGNIDRGFNHVSSGTWANLTKNPGDAGRRLADAFNLALPNRNKADRPFVLTGGGGSGGYRDNDIRALRNRLSFVNSATGALSPNPADDNVYYRHESGSSRTSSAVVQLSRDGQPDLKGYMLVNGFSRAQVGGDQTIARLSQAGSLQAYLDSGDTSIPGDASGRTVQIPRVEITAPTSSIITTANATVKFDVSWLRWDGEKYSPAYPEDWYDVTPLTFNAKYFDSNQINPNTGEPGVWIYVNTADKAFEKMDSNDLSYYDAAHELFPATSPEQMTQETEEKTFSWDVSGLENGNYKLRVECYRDNFRRTGYTYHDVYVTIKR